VPGQVQITHHPHPVGEVILGGEAFHLGDSVNVAILYVGFQV
jgi:hypothetical protein